jgi:hypothetical protein
MATRGWNQSYRNITWQQLQQALAQQEPQQPVHGEIFYVADLAYQVKIVRQPYLDQTTEIHYPE